MGERWERDGRGKEEGRQKGREEESLREVCGTCMVLENGYGQGKMKNRDK